MALAWALAPSDPDAGPSKAPVPESTAPLVPVAPLLTISGEVLTQEAAPISGATLYVLPKEYPGGGRDQFPHGTSDAQGKWTLRVQQVHDCWIGAQAPGRKIAWLDGSLVDPRAKLVHVLEAALPVRVVLRDPMGEPVARCGIEVIPWPLLQHYELPAPTFREPGSWVVTDEHGVAVVYLATPGPALLRPSPEGRCAQPEVGWLAADAKEFPFRIVPACTLDLCLEDPATGAPYEGVVTLRLKPLGSSARARTAVLSLTQGVGCVERSVAPGRYDVRLEASGCRPHVSQDVDLQEPGSRTRITARLEAAPAPGQLQLTLEGAPSGPKGRSLLFYARSTQAPLTVQAWAALRPSATPSEPVTLELEPGHYDLLVASPAARLCGVLRNVEVATATSQAATLALAPGVYTALTSIPAVAHELRRIQVVGATLGDLPVFGLGTSGRLRLDDELVELTTDSGGKEVFLGPYPDEQIRILLTTWSGQEREHPVLR